MSGNHILVAIDATVRAGQHRQEDGDDAIGGGHDLDLDYNYDFNYDYNYEYDGVVVRYKKSNLLEVAWW